MTDTDIAYVCASNDACVLRNNLLRSPCLRDTAPEVILGASSAARAHNAGLDRTSAGLVVFLHQDVYLPSGWEALLRARIAQVEQQDPDWALLGAYGVGLDDQGYGPVWSSSLGNIVGRVALSPQPVQSFDELLIVLRRDSGLRFDESLPGWHLHGTDIVTEARAKGLGAYVSALPLVHNDGLKPQLDAGFRTAYRYLQTKWTQQLPLRSPIIKISRSGHQLWRARWHNMRARPVRAAMALDTTTDAAAIAQACGWATVAP